MFFCNLGLPSKYKYKDLGNIATLKCDGARNASGQMVRQVVNKPAV